MDDLLSVDDVILIKEALHRRSDQLRRQNKEYLFRVKTSPGSIHNKFYKREIVTHVDLLHKINALLDRLQKETASRLLEQSDG